jgi:hypothetical protein
MRSVHAGIRAFSLRRSSAQSFFLQNTKRHLRAVIFVSTDIKLVRRHEIDPRLGIEPEGEPSHHLQVQLVVLKEPFEIPPLDRLLGRFKAEPDPVVEVAKPNDRV